MLSATRATTVVSQRQGFDLARICATEPQPGVLHGVVSLAERPEHPVGNRPEMRPMIFELPGEQFLLIHVTSLQRRVSRR
jgi:hypothetical protein